MSATRYDVIGIGNAIVDVLSHSDEDFLQRQKMPKGSMSLIDEARAEAIYNAMGPVIECSGGSAANTIVGVAMLGGAAAFVGKVKNDELGQDVYKRQAFGLRDAARDRDHLRAAFLCGFRAHFAQAAELGIDLLHRLFADMTGVQDNKVGLFGVRRFRIAIARQGVRHTTRVVDVHLAAERLDMNLASVGHRDGNT